MALLYSLHLRSSKNNKGTWGNSSFSRASAIIDSIFTKGVSIPEGVSTLSKEARETEGTEERGERLRSTYKRVN
jgi:hypothetical protein